MAIDLSTGQVAGIIAAGIFIVRILFRLLYPLMVCGFANLNETAVTFSRISRSLHASLWPTLMKGDSTTGKGVRLPIRLTTTLGSASALILSLASIITPLGLYESIAPGNQQQDVQFAFARDQSVFGLGTLPRPAEGFNRMCGFVVPVACPWSSNNITVTRNETGILSETGDTIDTTIPEDYVQYLQSGLGRLGKTVSSIFDIGYRVYTYSTDARDSTINGGRKRAVGSFNQFTTLLLQDEIQLVEGLIVDTINGGIGFRNHTVPAASKYGATWTEDILFIEPVTECVNSNLTFEWDIPLDNRVLSTDVQNLVLVDNGGFAEMSDSFPELDTSKAQDDPQLQYRAWRAAWLNNAYTGLFLNVTNPGRSISGMQAFSYINSEMGKRFPMQSRDFENGNGEVATWLNRKLAIGDFGIGLDLPQFSTNGTEFTTNSSFLELNVPENPWLIRADNFSDARAVCSAVYPSDRVNLTNLASLCGTVMASPQQKDGQNVVRFEPGTSYAQSLFGCSSIIRAKIKTVDFKFNGTGLAGLTVVNIADKHYESKDSWPTWGIEMGGERLREYSPLWGIIDPSRQTRFDANMSLVQKPDFYIPGLVPPDGIASVSGNQNLPGVDFFTNALSVAYTIGIGSSDTFMDYSGSNNLGLYNKWANLSQTPEGAARIINLLWTDVSANSVVGTKSWLPNTVPLAKRDESGEQQVLVPVTEYARRVRYHIAYGIPAFIVLLLVASATAISFVMMVFGQTGPSRIRVFLHKTSVGRSVTALLYQDEATSGAPTAIWAERMGKTRIDYTTNVPRSAAVGGSPAAMSSEVYDPMLRSGKGQPAIGLREVK